MNIYFEQNSKVSGPTNNNQRKMNEELVANAVVFLKDPSIVSSPLAKRIEFLESKGLNGAEIEEALQRANSGAASSATSAPAIIPPSNASISPATPVNDYYNPPALPERDWKDLFIMATTTIGVTYGIYQVVTKYVIPHIIPPSKAAIEKDKEEISDEFVKIDKILEQLTKEQEELKLNNQEKLANIDTVTKDITEFLNDNKEVKYKFENDLKLIKLEVDSIKSSINNSLDKQKSVINDELSNISKEMVSLKQLIASRNFEKKIPSISSIPSASEILKNSRNSKSPPREETKVGKTENTLEEPAKAGIPSWQQAGLSNGDVGATSWQGAASDSTSTSTATDKKDGIPSWQTNN